MENAISRQDVVETADHLMRNVEEAHGKNPNASASAAPRGPEMICMRLLISWLGADVTKLNSGPSETERSCLFFSVGTRRSWKSGTPSLGQAMR